MAAWVVVALVYLLHQDLWFWRAARPLVFGFLPIGLAYHAAYTIAVSVVLAWLVERHWPSHLGDPDGSPEGLRDGHRTPPE
jgi:hypothetical protein